MAEQSISVPTSGVITLNVALAAGSTISNSSSNSAIWVSANPAVTPGNGMRIGPKGSLQWTTDKTPCYAIADTGITAPVSITISDNVAQLVNPVDIGVAVATQLLNTGVPSVLVGNALPSAPLIDIDVSKYASIQISFLAQSPGIVSLSFSASVPDQLPPNDVMAMGDKKLVIANAGYVVMSIPVAGPRFSIVGLAGLVVTKFTIYGSNRETRFRLYPEMSTYAGRYDGAIVAGTVYNLSSALVSCGGMSTVTATVIAAATTKAIVGMTVADPYTNTITNMVLTDTTQMHIRPDATFVQTVTFNMVMPPGIIVFSVRALTANATSTLQVHVTT